MRRLGANVTGISLPPVTQPNLFDLSSLSQRIESQFCDIRNQIDLTARIRSLSPEIVFHLAALPLVRQSYREPIETFSTNVMGTIHVLDSIRGLKSAKVAVIVTTDKVYRDQVPPRPYRENDALGGHDPYSASKAACEMAVASYRHSYLGEQGVAVATARAGNVIGGGDWSEDRLIPDAMRAWQAGATLRIRQPDAVRPWQHVLEPLAGYLVLAEKLHRMPESAGAYNFGPNTDEVATVREVVGLASTAFGGAEVMYEDETGPHEMGRLMLDTAKARVELGLKPRWDLKTAVGKTVQWYRRLAQGADAELLCESDIADFESST
jgi:CDP-glucose 4,6-dehydratase